MKLTRENAILSFPTAVNQESSLLGHVVGLFNGVLSGLDHDSLAAPLGACVHYEEAGSPASVALMSGGLSGTVKLKLDGAVAIGDMLVLGDGGVVYADPGVGARTQVGQALEAGVSGEMVEAILFHPVILT